MTAAAWAGAAGEVGTLDMLGKAGILAVTEILDAGNVITQQGYFFAVFGGQSNIGLSGKSAHRCHGLAMTFPRPQATGIGGQFCVYGGGT